MNPKKETFPKSDEEVQHQILAVVEAARTVDIVAIIERAERGQPAIPTGDWTAEDMRILATGVARLRRMIVLVDENRAKRAKKTRGAP